MERATGVCKAPIARDWIKKNLGIHKLAIFAKSVMVVKAIAEFLKEMNVSHFVVTGEVKDRNSYLEALADRTNTTWQVGVMTAETCGRGLTLSPGVWRTLVVETGWDATLMEQVCCRTWRLGCAEPPTIWFLHALNSGDQGTAAVLQAKSQANSLVMDGVKAERLFNRVETFAP